MTPKPWVPYLQLSLTVFCFTLSLVCLLYKIPLDSDRLYFDDLFRDLLSGGRFTDWRLAVAPGYLPDLLLYGIAYVVLPSAPLRLLFVSAMQGLSCLAATLWIAKELQSRFNLYVAILLLGMLSLVITASTQSGAWVFINSNNAHVPATLISLISLAALLCYLRTKSSLVLLLLIVLGIAGTLSTALYVLCFPIGAVLLLLVAAAKDRSNAGGFFRAIAGILLGQGLAYALRPIVVFNDVFNTRVPMSIAAAQHSAIIFVENTFALLHQPWTGALVTCLAIFSAAIVLRTTITSTSHSVPLVLRFAGSFWVLSVIVTALGSILSGGFGDLYAFRYFAAHIALVVTLAAVVLGIVHPNFLRGMNWVVIVATMIATPIAYSELRVESGGLAPTVMALHGKGRIGEEKVASCVDEWVAAGIPLRSGASQYWLARAIEFRTEQHPMAAVFNDLNPFFWMSTAGPMLRPEHYSRFYNFLIVQTGGELAPFDFTPEEVKKHAPVPDRILKCSLSPVQIWYYEKDSLNRVVYEKAKQFIEHAELR